MSGTDRIALLIHSMAGGGAERMLLNLANELSERNYKIDLVLAEASGPYLSEISSAINVVELGGESAPRLLSHLIGYLHRVEPDVILSTTEVMNIIALVATNVPTISTRSVIRVCNINSKKSRETKKRRLLPVLQRLLYPRADNIIAISEGVKEDVITTGNVEKSNIKVIYNPAYDETIEELCTQYPGDDDWFSTDEAIRVLGVGRLAEQKDFGTLLQAFSIVQEDRESRLTILGEGPKRDRLQEQARSLGIADSVSIPGFVDNPYAYMHRADVFVLSSAWEGFGNVLVEALATGTSVVSTDCPGGPSEILCGGKYGSLVPVGDDDRMAEAILKELNDDGNSEARRRRARDFSLQASVDRYEMVLNDCELD